MTTAQDQQRRAEFDAWWDEFGQYGRAGGGGYEKTFAYAAWKAQADRAAAQAQAMGRVPPAVKKSYAHDFRPHAEYPWFCADCGYAPHDTLHSQAPRPPVAQDVPSYLAQMFGPGPALRPPAAQSQNLSNSAEFRRKPLDRIAVLVKIDAVLCNEKNPLQAAEEICAMANQGITHPTGD